MIQVITKEGVEDEASSFDPVENFGQMYVVLFCQAPEILGRLGILQSMVVN